MSDDEANAKRATRAKRQKAWRERNPERVRALQEAYRKRRPDLVKARERRFRERNIEKIRRKEKERRGDEDYKKQRAAWKRARDTKIADLLAVLRAEMPDLLKEFGL